MSQRLSKIARRISQELNELDRVVRRAQQAWRRSQQSDDDLYLDAVALNLHGFYSGLERLFELISANIDGTVPQGANWHRVLLEQMASEVPGVRPAVVSEAVLKALDEYRGFRHVVRYIYTLRLTGRRSARNVFTGAIGVVCIC